MSVFLFIVILYNFSISPSSVWTPLWEYLAHLSGDVEKSKKDGEECQVGWLFSGFDFSQFSCLYCPFSFCSSLFAPVTESPIFELFKYICVIYLLLQATLKVSQGAK